MLAPHDLNTVELFGFTMGQFSLMELLLASLDRTGPADVDVSVWTAADSDLRDAYTLIESGKIRKFRLLVDQSFETRQPDYCKTLRQLFGDKCVRIAKIHAKCAVLTNSMWDLSIRTSMNLNRNTRWEQFEMSNDPSLAAFIRGIFDQTFAGESIIGARNEVTEATKRVFF
jgi:hypothetical protein